MDQRFRENFLKNVDPVNAVILVASPGSRASNRSPVPIVHTLIMHHVEFIHTALDLPHQI